MPPYSPQQFHPTRFHVILNRALRIIIYTILCLLLCACIMAIFITKFGDDHQGAKLYAAQTDLSILQSVLDTFAQDTGRYPTTSEGLKALLTNPNLPNWKGPYVRKIPNDPWGNAYLYQCPGDDHTKYTLSSNGPDKSPHTDDDITTQ